MFLQYYGDWPSWKILIFLLEYLLPNFSSRWFKLNWKQFQNKEIKALFNVQVPWTLEAIKYVAYFERVTGIHVNLTLLTEEKFMFELENALKGQEHFDVVHVPMGHWAFKYYKHNELSPLDQYINDYSITDIEWYDLADFNTKFLNAFRFPGPEKGKLYAIPLTFEIYPIFYKEDLMAKKGIDPKSLKLIEDWINILPDLYFRDQKSGEVIIYPAVIRGGGTTDIIDPLNSLILSYWGDRPYDFEKFVYFDETWKPRFNDPSIVKAFKTWATIMKFAPKSITNFSWYDAFRFFIENKAVTWWYDAHILAYYFKNGQSNMSSEIGYVLPKVDNYKNSCFWCWGIGIPEKISDDNKRVAWVFIEWLTSKEISEKIAKKVYSSTRNSILNSKSFKHSLPKQLNEIIYSILDKMQPSVVYMEDFDQIILLIRDTIHKIYQGSEPNESISWLQRKVEELRQKFDKDLYTK